MNRSLLFFLALALLLSACPKQIAPVDSRSAEVKVKEWLAQEAAERESNLPGYAFAELNYFALVLSKVQSEWYSNQELQPEQALAAALASLPATTEGVTAELDADRGEVVVVVSDEEFRRARDDRASWPDALATLQEVAEFLDARLDPEVGRESIEFALIQGLVASLDQHSAFYPPGILNSVDGQDVSGETGLTVVQDAEALRIVRVHAGGPAAEAGVALGSALTTVDGQDVSGLSLKKLAGRLRGPIGSTVTLGLVTNGAASEATVKRARIVAPSIVATRLGAFGVVKVWTLERNTHDEVRQILQRWLEPESGDEPLGGVVVDLRSNPGGYLQVAIEIADLFVAEGPLFSLGTRGSGEESTQARRFGTAWEGPLVVLVNEDTCSGAEVIAGALQAQGSGLVVGTRTNGAGAVRNVFDRGLGGAHLVLTIGQMMVEGKTLEGRGIWPDVELRPVRPNDLPAEAGVSTASMAIHPNWRPPEWTSEAPPGSLPPRWSFECLECFDADAKAWPPSPEDVLADPEILAAITLLTTRCTTSSKLRECLKAGAATALHPVLGKPDVR